MISNALSIGTKEELRVHVQQEDPAGKSLAACIDMLTIGQYLSPSNHHLPVLRYVHPDVFKEFEEKAYQMGFSHAAVGAMVRSSYHADQQAHEAGVV